ncbi:hypothetical protein L2E82_22909 [Cichorium intybus]|uniref:Uncharacterized protein n=1 Tax=Cichorium intybus TaxID=13427 RepID=A0ACB9DZR5_CICIN|nr:hypothetical protein L2E82_22909 [Cichorium intybus]
MRLAAIIVPSPDVFNFDQVTSLNISPEVERFSLNGSLSKLFSDVLPQYIDAEIDQQIVRAVTSEDSVLQVLRNIIAIDYAPCSYLVFDHTRLGTGERRKQKPHRFKPGTQALREIRHLQKIVNLLIPTAPFILTVKEISNYIAPEVTRWQAESSIIIAESSRL